MVPNGWVNTTFGEHIDLLNGFAFKSALYSEDENDIKLLRGDNIEPNKLRWRNVKRWSKSESDSFEKFHLKEGDFIVAMDRTWITAGLKVAEVKKDDLPCLLVQRVSRIRSLPTLCQDLIKHYFSGYKFEQYVKSVQTETAVPHISPTQIKDFDLLLPPLAEQQKIAKILTTWDKAINTTERLIDNSTQQKKALMQQLLTGKKRLLDDSGKAFEGEWNSIQLSEVVKVTGGNAFKSEEFIEVGIPLIRISNIKVDYSISTNSSVFISSDKKHERFKIVKGDVLIAMSGATTGKIGRYNSEVPAYLNQRVGRFDVKKGLTTRLYIFHLLKLPKVQHEILIDAVGGAQPNISNKDIERIQVMMSCTEEQNKIATVLTNADKEIELLEQQLADFQQEKKALMQQLLTGKRRVVV